MPLSVVQLFHLLGEENEVGLRGRRLHTPKLRMQNLSGRPLPGRTSSADLELEESNQPFDPASAGKKSLVVMSHAMPDGTSSPTRPCGATNRQASSANTA